MASSNSQSAGQARSTFAAAALRDVATIAVQLGLLIYLVHGFELVSPAFLKLAVLAGAGFIVHALLPASWRLPFFLALSIGGIFIVVGVQPALWLLGLGLALIVIAHLPAPLWLRAGLLVVTAGGLAVLRVAPSLSPVPPFVWPILASMFMFRMLIYLYDRSHEEQHRSFVWTASYFFLLPNVCFPLFPIVDYRRFCSGYYDEEATVTYQRGVNWFFRGVTHLILYRLVYQNWTIDPNTVTNTAELVRFMISSYLLYLRVSGLFHIAVGMLLLFGFNLPETNHHYYLASSFTDCWRRINIYWKDFMMKIFYYPVYLKLRKLGGTWAIILSTAIVFFITWALHAFQWFWLRGALLLAWNDGFFWIVLAVLVAINSIWEQRHSRERNLAKVSRTFLGRTGRALQIAATFLTISILWSLWTADSLRQWFLLWEITGPSSWTVLALPVILFLVAGAMQRVDFQRQIEADQPIEIAPAKPAAELVRRQRLVTVAGSIALCALAVPGLLPLGEAEDSTLASLRTHRLNERDRRGLERGYYEQILSVSSQSAELWALAAKKPENWQRLQETEIWKPTDDMLMGALEPNKEIEFKGSTITTNAWGLRDQHYEKEKPEGTYRMALLGSSHVMGSGVENDEVFEAVLEERLNREVHPDPIDRIEVLNFAIAARSSVQHLFLAESRVLDFEPDAILHVAHVNDDTINLRYLLKLMQSDVEIVYPELEAILAEAGIDRDDHPMEIQLRLRLHLESIVEWAYRSFAELCREHGVLPVWVYLPTVTEESDPELIARRMRQASEAGFAVIDLAGVYDEYDIPTLTVAEWDDHPNALAHRLLADSLYGKLTAPGGILGPSSKAQEPQG